MPDAFALKLTQTTACFGLVLAGALFGGGYLYGELVAERRCQSEIVRATENAAGMSMQLMRVNENCMRFFHELRTQRQADALRNPEPSSVSDPSSAGGRTYGEITAERGM